MIIRLSLDSMIAQSCSESPWSFVDVFDPQIVIWLDHHLSNESWDYWILSDHILVRIDDPKIALLFKLTWGGS